MITEEYIKQWWNRKVMNYIQNYFKRNKLLLAQERERLFAETHQNFIEVVPHELKKLIDHINAQNRPGQ